ncbi:MAG: Crp/Fnr family transcriptional regulator, partial [Fervidobacterium sp.]
LIDGKVLVTLHSKSEVFEQGTFGEWALFNMPSEEEVSVIDNEATFYILKPEEIFNVENYEKILKAMISSISKRLLLIDAELAQSQSLPEYVGPDRMRYFKRTYPNSMKLTDNFFQDFLSVKRFYANGYYREAFEVLLKIMSYTISEDLKKELMAWHTLLSIIIDPEKAELHFRRLNPKEYGDSLSYAYLVSFFKGGQKQELLEMYMKAGLYLPPYTIVTTEGEMASEGYFLLKGYLKAVKLYEDKEVLLSIVKPGEFVGESALIESRTRMVTLYSISPAAIIPINCEGIQKTIRSNPNFILKLCESQIKRIKQVKELINLKKSIGSMQRIDLALKYFSDIIDKANITVKDISSISDCSYEEVIEELRKKGFKISMSGVISI